MLIAVEGIDGSGKGTQVELLVQALSDAGISCKTFSFPGYGDNAFGVAISEYLNGGYGDVNRLPAELISLLFAGDRFTAKNSILKEIQECEVVVCDRYVNSNLAHQGAKIYDKGLRPRFFDWLREVEYGIFGMPRPTLNVFLDMPVEKAQVFVARKKSRTYTDLTLDYHEKDTEYLRRCKSVYDELICIANEPWVRVCCLTVDGLERTREDICSEILCALRARGLRC